MKADARSEKNIVTLRPEVQELARALVEKGRVAGINVKVIGGTRTYAEQEALYEQGRSKPGKIVTKARAGQSKHNFGIAFDVGVFSDDGKEYYGESNAYAELGKIGKELGLVWGGDWEDFPDEPHFEYNPKGHSLAEIRARHEAALSLFT